MMTLSFAIITIIIGLRLRKVAGSEWACVQVY